MTDKATVIHVHNPFNPAKDRSVSQPRGGFSIQSYFNRHPSLSSYAVVCMVNSEPVLRRDWEATIIKANDIVVFFRLPEGGGSDKKRKNPLLAVVGIALAVVGSVIGGFIGGAIAIGGILLTVGAIGSGLIGSPKTPSVDQGRTRSPTYSLTARGNNARLGEAIPAVYGDHLIYPDFATQPWVEYINNEQYLHMLLVIGQGLHHVDRINIDDTNITNFDDEASSQIVNPGDAITLFDDQVIAAVEVNAQELRGPNDDGGWVGPFVVVPDDEESNIRVDRLDIDIAFPQGLGYIDNASGAKGSFSVHFELQYQVVVNGEGIGNWVNIGSETVSTPDVSKFQTAVRRTFKYSLPSNIGIGGLQVRMRRTTNKDNNPNATIAQQLNWIGAKVKYTSPPTDYGDITMVAVRLKASDNLSGSVARKVNCRVRRRIPVWSATTKTWSAPTFTNSPVWVVMDLLKSKYGGRLDDTRVDLDAMAKLADYFASNNYTFNGIFDRKMSLWEALRLVCRSCRCAGILQAGRFQMVRDRLQTIPVAMFSPRNIVKDSFSIAYSMPTEDTSDGVVVEYVDPYSFKPKQVAAWQEGADRVRPATVKLFGCTNRAQALREAKFLVKNDMYRRKTIHLTTELEGYIPTFGDLVVVSHDMPEWGLSGDVIGIKDDGTIVLSEHPGFSYGNHYIAFRTKTGGVAGPFLVEAGTNPNEVRLSGLWQFTRLIDNGTVVLSNGSSGESFEIYHGTSKERTHFSFGLADSWRQKGVVRSIRPRGDLQVQLEILAEDDRVHLDT